MKAQGISLAIDNFGEELGNLLLRHGSERKGLDHAAKRLETMKGVDLVEIKLHTNLVRDC